MPYFYFTRKKKEERVHTKGLLRKLKIKKIIIFE